MVKMNSWLKNNMLQIKINIPTMKKVIILLTLAFVQHVSLLHAQSTLNYPGRYMGKEETKTITAPNGAVANAGFAQTLQLIYPKPTIIKEADGI